MAIMDLDRHMTFAYVMDKRRKVRRPERTLRTMYTRPVHEAVK
jgi:hypothetical protein